ncbi:unnamed protein product [Ixodes persulcatus]
MRTPSSVALPTGYRNGAVAPFRCRTLPIDLGPHLIISKPSHIKEILQRTILADKVQNEQR